LSGGYPSWADNSSQEVLNMERFNNESNFTYAEYANGLIYNSNVILTYFLINKVFVVLDIFLDTHSLSILWVFLPYLTLYLSVYFSLVNIFKRNSLSFFLTMFYIFSLHNFTQVAYGWSTTIYSQAFSFLLISYFIKYLRSPLIKYILVISVLTLVAFINIAHFYGVALFCIMLIVVSVLINNLNIREIANSYKTLLLLPILSLLLNSYWILPNFFMSREVAFNYSIENIYSSSIYTFFNSFNFINNFSSDSILSVIMFHYFNSVLYRLLFFSLLVAVFYHLYRNFLKNKPALVFFSLYLLVFSLSMGENSGLIWRIFNMLPGSFIIRSPQLKFYPILFFLLLILVGYVLERGGVKSTERIFLAVILAGIFCFFKGDLFSYWTNIKLPSDYVEVVNYLNSDNRKYYTVMEFPKTSGPPTISWRNDIYVIPLINSMISNPLVQKTWGDGAVPVYLREAYGEGSVEIANVLGRGGVKYVLVHHDFSNFPMKTDFSNIPGINQVVYGENVDLFEIEDRLYKPLFFSRDKNLGFTRISPVMHTVVAEPGTTVTFNRQHDVSLVMYDDRDLEDVGYHNCNFSIGDLNFCDILLLKVKPLPKQPLDNDYKNNWITPTDSSGSYVVYYEPQIYFYIGLIISFLAFLLHVFLLVKLSLSERRETRVS